MNDRKHQPYWVFLYRDFQSQTDPEKMKERLKQLEAAMWERLMELERDPSANVERAAIEAVSQELFEIKKGQAWISANQSGLGRMRQTYTQELAE